MNNKTDANNDIFSSLLLLLSNLPTTFTIFCAWHPVLQSIGFLLYGPVKPLNSLVDFWGSCHQSVSIFQSQVDAFLPGQPFLSDVVPVEFSNVHVDSVPERLDHDVTVGAKGYSQLFPIRREGGEFNRSLLHRVRFGVRCSLSIPPRFDIFTRASTPFRVSLFTFFGHFHHLLTVIIVVLSPILFVSEHVSFYYGLSLLASHVYTEGVRVQEWGV